MKRAMAMVLAGGLGAAGLLVPGVASSHGRDGERVGCRDEGHGPRGMRGLRGMMDGGMMEGGMMEGGRAGHGAIGRGLGPVWRLDLTDVQRTQLTRLTDALRRAHWATMGKMLDANAKLRDLEAQPQPDPKQVGAAFAEVSKLRQEMLEATVRSRNDARALLTPPQREQLDRWRTRGSAPDAATGGRAEMGAGGDSDAGEQEESH